MTIWPKRLYSDPISIVARPVVDRAETEVKNVSIRGISFSWQIGSARMRNPRHE